MTAALTAATTEPPVGWRPIGALASLEARRYAGRASVWLGWAASAALAVTHRTDWPGGAYADVVPMSFAPLALGTFVAAARTGGRDRDAEGDPLAEEAVLGADARATARLLGLAMPVAAAAVTALTIAIVTRIEGGFWLGEGARRTDAARHTVAELIQPVLLVALTGALGVAAGRRLRSVVVAITAGVFVWTAVFALSWMWNGPTMYPWAPVQTMPLRIPLDEVRGFGDTPTDWYVESPTEYQRAFTRQLVHAPTVTLHLVYLLGLVLLAGAAARRTRVVGWAGAALAAAGVAGQLLVSPF